MLKAEAKNKIDKPLYVAFHKTGQGSSGSPSSNGSHGVHAIIAPKYDTCLVSCTTSYTATWGWTTMFDWKPIRESRQSQGHIQQQACLNTHNVLYDLLTSNCQHFARELR